jgi:DNA-binding MarR family transcriptional regulator
MATPAQSPNESILEGLARYPQATAAELAEAIGIGKSTATRYLAALEVEGKAVRTPGGWEDGKRFSDRWSLVPEDSEPVGTPTVTAAAGAKGPSKSATAASTSTPAAMPATADGRLQKGVLATMVLDYLAAHPKDSFGPSALAKVLDRSGGAISNALAAMAVRGDVVLVSDKPRRYRISSPK